MNYEDRVTKGAVEGLIAGCAKIEAGTYVGTGTYGAENPTSLTFPFEPKFVWIGNAPTTDNPGLLLWHAGVRENSFYSSDYKLTISQSDNTISWYNANSANNQLNSANRSYCYLVLG